MKLLALFFLSFISISLGSQYYKCSDDLKAKTCYLETKKQGRKIIYVQDCKKGKVCSSLKEEEMNQCIKPPNKKSEDGQKCLVDEECLGGICSKEKCESAKEGATAQGKCGISMYMTQTINGNTVEKKCNALIKEGNKCRYSYECEIGLICGFVKKGDSKKCTKAFSIENGAYSSNGMLCKSGQIYQTSVSETICATYQNGEYQKDKGTCTYDIVIDSKNTFEGVELNPKDYIQSDEDALDAFFIQSLEGNVVCKELSGSHWEHYLTVYNKEIDSIKKEAFSCDYDGDRRYYYNNAKIKKAWADWFYKDLFDVSNNCVKKALRQHEDSGNFIFSSLMSLIILCIIII